MYICIDTTQCEIYEIAIAKFDLRGVECGGYTKHCMHPSSRLKWRVLYVQ